MKPMKGFYVIDENQFVTLKSVEPVYSALIYLSRRILSSNYENFTSNKDLMNMLQFIVENDETGLDYYRKDQYFSLMYRLSAGNHLHGLVHYDFFAHVATKYKSHLKVFNKKLSMDGYNMSYKLLSLLKCLKIPDVEAQILKKELQTEVTTGVTLRDQLKDKLSCDHLNSTFVGQFIIDKYLFRCGLITQEMRIKHLINTQTKVVSGFDFITSASDESVIKAFVYTKLWNLYKPPPIQAENGKEGDDDFDDNDTSSGTSNQGFDDDDTEDNVDDDNGAAHDESFNSEGGQRLTAKRMQAHHKDEWNFIMKQANALFFVSILAYAHKSF
jgi:hypothetical protein